MISFRTYPTATGAYKWHKRLPRYTGKNTEIWHSNQTCTGFIYMTDGCM